MRQAGLFGLSDQLKRLSGCGNPLETMGRVVDFEVFRPALEKALACGDGTKGGRPPYDPVAMLKVLMAARTKRSEPSAAKSAAFRPAEWRAMLLSCRDSVRRHVNVGVQLGGSCEGIFAG